MVEGNLNEDYEPVNIREDDVNNDDSYRSMSFNQRSKIGLIMVISGALILGSGCLEGVVSPPRSAARGVYDAADIMQSKEWKERSA